MKPLVSLVVISLLLYTLTLRGHPGNPNPSQIKDDQSVSGQPFETSQERSRWALILSLYHDRSFIIDNYAAMGTPDIGFARGHFFSSSPAVSLLAIPLYALGLKLGIAQLVVFTLPAFFALGTMLILFRFCRRLNLHWSVALFSALAFGFSTSAWGYSVTLFAHLLSAFLLTAGLYLASFWSAHSFSKACLIWLLYAISVFVDFPNLFLYLPIVAAVSANSLSLSSSGQKYSLHVRLRYLVAPLIFVVLMSGYGWYNSVHFGSPTKLSNTIARVRDLEDVSKSAPEGGKTSSGSLRPRSLLTGLHTFLVSHDRSVAIYTPAILLFVFGLAALAKTHPKTALLLISVPALCLVLYSMFDDPYGGWAFGSRYLVAVMPPLIILAGVGLQKFARNFLVKLIYTLVIAYSTFSVLMAPLTTNVIPPYVEARYLGLDSTYIINWRMLENSELNSYFYNHILNASVSGPAYYFAILIPLVLLFVFLIWLPKYAPHSKSARHR